VVKAERATRSRRSACGRKFFQQCLAGPSRPRSASWCRRCVPILDGDLGWSAPNDDRRAHRCGASASSRLSAFRMAKANVRDPWGVSPVIRLFFPSTTEEKHVKREAGVTKESRPRRRTEANKDEAAMNESRRGRILQDHRGDSFVVFVTRPRFGGLDCVAIPWVHGGSCMFNGQRGAGQISFPRRQLARAFLPICVRKGSRSNQFEIRSKLRFPCFVRGVSQTITSPAARHFGRFLKAHMLPACRFPLWQTWRSSKRRERQPRSLYLARLPQFHAS